MDVQAVGQKADEDVRFNPLFVLMKDGAQKIFLGSHPNS
jgi:hypothetical protein